MVEIKGAVSRRTMLGAMALSATATAVPPTAVPDPRLREALTAEGPSAAGGRGFPKGFPLPFGVG